MRTKKLLDRDTRSFASSAINDAPLNCCVCGREFGSEEARFRFGPLPGEKYAIGEYPYADVCLRDECVDRYRAMVWNREEETSKRRVVRKRTRSTARKAA